ncbi:hypothetical protein [uncultured Celeribacter sp.]|uniref:hypothetical protein n=1 Tax=uncultured Celeribacter sp. TaxID=1303376 RepID=UPI002AA8A2E8|nr:hypothetical protein [uncultured Celeribacter sp.]
MTSDKRIFEMKDHLTPDGQLSDELKQFLQATLTRMRANAVDHKQPPWSAFPDYERGSMGFRMGPGEDYWFAFVKWIRSLSPSVLAVFIARNPEPQGWEGFYDQFGSE